MFIPTEPPNVLYSILDTHRIQHVENVANMNFDVNQDNSALSGVTIVTTCKGRLSHLSDSVPRLLRQRTSRKFLIVVVDYGDPDGCFEWVVEKSHPQLGALRVTTNVDEFNLSRARNCGASMATHPLVSFVDADALFGETWLEKATAPILSGRAVATIPDWQSPACGICTVRRSIFHRVRGFDESFRGWGHEDIDFVDRVSQLGSVEGYDANLITMIPHNPDLRMRYYTEKDFEMSHLENDERATIRQGPVNPDGYGGGDFEFFGPPAMCKATTQS